MNTKNFALFVWLLVFVSSVHGRPIVATGTGHPALPAAPPDIRVPTQLVAFDSTSILPDLDMAETDENLETTLTTTGTLVTEFWSESGNAGPPRLLDDSDPSSTSRQEVLASTPTGGKSSAVTTTGTLVTEFWSESGNAGPPRLLDDSDPSSTSRQEVLASTPTGGKSSAVTTTGTLVTEFWSESGNAGPPRLLDDSDPSSTSRQEVLASTPTGGKSSAGTTTGTLVTEFWSESGNAGPPRLLDDSDPSSTSRQEVLASTPTGGKSSAVTTTGTLVTEFWSESGNAGPPRLLDDSDPSSTSRQEVLASTPTGGKSSAVTTTGTLVTEFWSESGNAGPPRLLDDSDPSSTSRQEVLASTPTGGKSSAGTVLTTDMSSTPEHTVDHKGHALLFFLFAALVVLPLRTTLFRVGRACHSKAVSFTIYAIFTMMLSSAIMEALVLESKHGGGGLVTDVICGKIGLLWITLVGVSSLAGIVSPCCANWRERLTFCSGFGADLAFVLSFYLEFHNELLKIVQNKTWSGAWVSLENKFGTKWAWEITKEDILFSLVIYHFVNGLLEYSAKRYTNDNETISTLLDDEADMRHGQSRYPMGSRFKARTVRRQKLPNQLPRTMNDTAVQDEGSLPTGTETSPSTSGALNELPKTDETIITLETEPRPGVPAPYMETEL